ncbi:site-specific integrase [Bradyrhizobium sp. CCGE-LA001]|uniref:site-specific integrase n=1 Tax=Bradyrhizobium sp. CCGE-LA001 TaxID=1223566 RepID=UPI000745B373|nr:site-specific integrase [Bradyrhizobium sp. CCGE-LA001]AMA60076.1 hypothetical protein BCCGELA001_30125 [Bradyrhizobium sp. CCGE-LA001]
MVSTLSRRVAAVRYAHKLASLLAPSDAEAVKVTLRGIRRTLGAAKVKEAPAIVTRIKAMVETCPDTLTGKRDRALLLLGFGGAFRRSELVALDVEHLEVAAEGLRVFIARSKTDQDAERHIYSHRPGIRRLSRRRCPELARCFRHHLWPRFSTDQQSRNGEQSAAHGSISRQHRQSPCLPSGLDERQFSGHSLGRGFLTSAAAAGKSIFRMMDVSRHKSVETLRGYVQEAELFRNHAGAGLL